MVVRLGDFVFLRTHLLSTNPRQYFSTPINFNNAFFAFMESAAMYLRCVHIISDAKECWFHYVPVCRDTSKIVEAVSTYRSGNNKKDALRLLEESTSQIDALVCTMDLIEHSLISEYCYTQADMWGMHFVQICGRCFHLAQTLHFLKKLYRFCYCKIITYLP